MNLGEYNISEIKKLRIGHNSTHPDNNWYLSKVCFHNNTI